jgi:bifunctional NMN adenylyltransferase/nudix hydrolase
MKTDIGVIVGRFQVARLSTGHRELIEHVQRETNQTIIVLGDSPVHVTQNNPLSVDMRKQMILGEFSNIFMLSLEDQKHDDDWSKSLDNLISKNIPPYSTVKLYGSRDSFLESYSGKYPTERTEQRNNSISGTDHRMQVACSPRYNEDFRRGIIWATQNQYKSIQTMVDVAPIILIDGDPHVVLIHKVPDGKGWLRFAGGYVDANDIDGLFDGSVLGQNAIREMTEETGLIPTEGYFRDNVKYLGTFGIQDWRYKDSRVMSAFFVINAKGTAIAQDDADEVKVVSVRDYVNIVWTSIVEEHAGLAVALRSHLIDLYGTEPYNK